VANESWDDVRAELRARLLDTATLVRAVGAGRRRGVALDWRRAELRPVRLKGGVRLQVTTYDQRQAHTANHDATSAAGAVDALLAQGFGNWHVETADEVVQVRITKKGDAQVHRAGRDAPVEVEPAAHDRVKARLLDVAHPAVRDYLQAVGVADPEGRVKPSRQDKYRQVEEFVRLLDASVEDARAAGSLREPTDESPWYLVDLGCGHAYLTIGAYVWFAHVRGLPVRVHGVDVRSRLARPEREAREHARLGRRPHVRGGDDRRRARPAAARHRRGAARLRHRDRRRARPRGAVGGTGGARRHRAATTTSRLRSRGTTRRRRTPSWRGYGLLRERFVDVLTDAVRAALMRIVGYRVDAVEFVSDEHTNRNLMLRAVRTGAAASAADLAELDALVADWQVEPALAQRIPDELESARARVERD
jgi:hypothetical protein